MTKLSESQIAALHEHLAINVMGYWVVNADYITKDGRFICEIKDWLPTTNANQTLDCLGKVKWHRDVNGWVHVWNDNQIRFVFFKGKKFQLAACIAMAKATGFDIGG